MGSQLNPCLAFTGNARQAIEFYQGILGGKLEMGTYAEYGFPDVPAPDNIMHATLRTSDGHTLMAWDVREEMPHTPGNNVAVFLDGDDAKLRDYFERLSVGGIVTLPWGKQSWGADAGSLMDRFGITWMVSITHQQAG